MHTEPQLSIPVVQILGGLKKKVQAYMRVSSLTILGALIREYNTVFSGGPEQMLTPIGPPSATFLKAELLTVRGTTKSSSLILDLGIPMNTNVKNGIDADNRS